MSSTKLKNAPLKEVIFELYWECSVNNVGMQIDRGFDLAQGKFAERLKSSFPIHKKLIPEGSSFKIFGAPLHQYWNDEFTWPVIQHGEGMIAVNQIEAGYEWDNQFKPLVIDTIGKLMESYEDVPKFNKIKLQYIDAWDLKDMAPSEFVSQNLQTSITAKYSPPGILRSFSIQQNFELNDNSTLNLSISDGINNENQKKSVIWTTAVEKVSLIKFEEIDIWIENAHAATSNMFKQMLNPEFYASLDK